jgi:hypothetical protein
MLRLPGSAKRKRRNLASAFVGEVSAIMTLIEEIAQPQPDCERPVSNQAHLALPGCDLYKANAGQLDVFDAPLPSQLTHFYTRVASLPELLCAHAERHLAAEGQLINRPLDPEFEHILAEGEGLLRNLRPFVSRPHSPTITRA